MIQKTTNAFKKHFKGFLTFIFIHLAVCEPRDKHTVYFKPDTVPINYILSVNL